MDVTYSCVFQMRARPQPCLYVVARIFLQHDNSASISVLLTVNISGIMSILKVEKSVEMYRYHPYAGQYNPYAGQYNPYVGQHNP